jgi:hypothetical protein
MQISVWGLSEPYRPDLLMMAGYFREYPDRVKPDVLSILDVNELKGKIFEGMVWAGISCALIFTSVLERLHFVFSVSEFNRKVEVHDHLFLLEAQRLGYRVLLH